MKFWFEGIVEQEDGDKQCSKCRVWQKPGKTIYVEFFLQGGGTPHIDELHPEPTGKVMCHACGQMTLV